MGRFISGVRHARPLFYTVPSDEVFRCNAGQDLIRPDEVWTLISGPLRNMALSFGAGDATSLAMRQLLATRRLRYEPDGDMDVWRSPKLTLSLKYGDCEDHAFVAASIAANLGVEPFIAVGEVFVRGAWHGHAWVEGNDRRGFFLLEATSGALYRGSRPPIYRPQLFISRDECYRAA